jgi:hypothetical protein
MRYHGNYCGPNWSAGRHQPSVVSDVPAVDEFDETCRVHDAAYATGQDLFIADGAFYEANIGQGYKRSLAALAVKTQQLARGLTRNKIIIAPNNNFQHSSMPTPNLRKNTNQKSKTKSAAKSQSPIVLATPNTRSATAVSAPAAMGSVIRGTVAKTVKKSSNGIQMDVSVCNGRLNGAVQSIAPEMVGIQYLMPVALGNDEVQNMTRVYQRYRILSATVHFRSFQGTDTGGELIIVSNDDPNYRPINTATNSSFYQRALSAKHAVLTPIWMSTSMPLAIDPSWKVCDNSNSTTLEEFCSGVVYYYVDGTTQLPGYAIVDLRIEFDGLRFNSRNLISGSYLGLASKLSLSVVSPTTGAKAVITGSGFTPGDIYAVQLSTSGATFGVGVTAGTLWDISTGSGTVDFVITGSVIIYCRASTSTSLFAYVTYDSCVGDDAGDGLLNGVTTVTTSTFPSSYITQLRNSAQPTN